MTLDATEKVYQADLMHLTPASDSQIYGYGGSWILRGLELDYQGDSATLQTGSAILQGRLYELNQPKTIDLTHLNGTGYIGLLVDLTQTNAVVGNTVTNNQYTIVAQSGAAFGDLLAGDLQAFIPLWRVSGGIPSRVTLLYEEDTPLNSQFINGWSDTGEGSHIRRVGRTVVMTISIRKSADPTNKTFIKLDPGFCPSWRVLCVGSRNNDGRAIDILASPSGEVYTPFTTLSANDIIRGEFTWLIDQPNQ